MPFKDPEKRREYQRRYMRAWYQRNAKTQIERNQQRRRALRTWFAEFKATLKCSRCGENHPACLEFHHDDPSQKEVTINSALWQMDWGKDRILAEAAKCTVLCANCHRKLHWDEIPGVGFEPTTSRL
jgi:hypothetical protein